MKKKLIRTENDPAGKLEVDENGGRWWMGKFVHPCPMCGIAVTNVDECGNFGDPDCPAFGIGRETYNAIERGDSENA